MRNGECSIVLLSRPGAIPIAQMLCDGCKFLKGIE